MVFFFRNSGLAILAAAILAVPAHSTTTRHHAGAGSQTASKPASASSVRTGKSSRRGAKASRAVAAASHKLHGQQGIAPERATEIQQALIREHYLPGPATGEWDSTTVAAMQKYQSDHGWQTKLTPDSRAIIKLGLGADYSGAINAKNGSFTPPPSSTTPASQTAGFTAASGTHQ